MDAFNCFDNQDTSREAWHTLIPMPYSLVKRMIKEAFLKKCLSWFFYWDGHLKAMHNVSLPGLASLSHILYQNSYDRHAVKYLRQQALTRCKWLSLWWPVWDGYWMAGVMLHYRDTFIFRCCIRGNRKRELHHHFTDILHGIHHLLCAHKGNSWLFVGHVLH